MGHRPTAICAGEEDASDAVKGSSNPSKEEDILLEPVNGHVVADGSCGGSDGSASPPKIPA